MNLIGKKQQTEMIRQYLQLTNINENELPTKISISYLPSNQSLSKSKS